ncbi:MAG: UvrB/UvrC motif-containing protein [Clostridia bacterium]|nr:UvrB/UvrC motif-containing protein [Clostridia bacterium]
MICDECGKNLAVFSVTITSGSGTSNRHLCSDCMKKMEATFSQGTFHSFLSSILGMLGTAQQEQDERVCGHCGLHYSEFERTGRLGCAHCYQEFANELKPMLQRIHGSSQHVGRAPLNAAEPGESSVSVASEPTRQQLLEQRIQELRQKMDEAVTAENFEAAAQYRDEIRALTQEAGETSCS